MKLILVLMFSPWLAQAASKIYTGFNYGAFWGEPGNAKRKEDFVDGFQLAKNLTTTVPFDSARLFTSIAAQSSNEATGAFDAAVEAKTNLLLGFWITPAKRGDSPDAQIANEMAALNKGFQKHGQALADLIIGLSVGSEDIYRWEEKKDESGQSADVVAAAIEKVRKDIASSAFAKYMQGKPIGHVDTAKYVVVKGAEFYGMTAYPYWNRDGIEKARESFHGSLENVKQRAGNTPVWIAEMGWPAAVTKSDGFAGASVDSLQNFWTEIGCSVFGRYTTFWFELLKDSTAEQPDWGVIDIPSRQPRIKNLICPGAFPSASNPAASNSQPPPTLGASSSQGVAPSLSFASSVPTADSPISIPSPGGSSKSTIHIQTTIYTTVQPPSPVSTPSPAPPPSSEPDTDVVTVTTILTTTIITKLASALAIAQSASPDTIPATTSIPNPLPWCITVADIDHNGHPVTLAGGPAGPDGQCSPAPTYYGYPYVTSGASIKPTPVPIGVPWCVTVADVDGTGQMLPVDAGPAGTDGKCETPGVMTDVVAGSTAVSSEAVRSGTGMTPAVVASSSPILLTSSSPSTAASSGPPTVVSSSSLQVPASPTPASNAPTSPTSRQGNPCKLLSTYLSLRFSY